MEFSKLGDNAKNCRSYMTILLDDFYYLYKNHTAVESPSTVANIATPWTGVEKVFLNVTGIISGPY